MADGPGETKIADRTEIYRNVKRIKAEFIHLSFRLKKVMLSL